MIRRVDLLVRSLLNHQEKLCISVVIIQMRVLQSLTVFKIGSLDFHIEDALFHAQGFYSDLG